MVKTTLEERVRRIEERNKKVELDKKWETSYARRGLIVIFTYLAIALYLKFIVGVNPWINAIVPTVGFLLSTLTLPFFKKFWKNHIYNENAAHETQKSPVREAQKKAGTSNG